MGYEIDFLPVGDKGKSGDAIAIRFGQLDGPTPSQKVIIIDGGFKETGEALVSHVKTHFKTDVVDLVVLTHPDFDHSSGLEIVLEKLKVRAFLMHKAWTHTKGMSMLFEDGRISDKSLSGRLKESLENAHALESLAKEKGIPIWEPFQGLQAFNGVLTILGPSQEFYENLLTQLNCMPESNKEPGQENAFLKALREVKDKVAEWMSEHWNFDLIKDSGDPTNPQNNTSVILQLLIDGERLIFTGDAGREALLHAAEFQESAGIKVGTLGFIQIPHHGSFRNVGPTALNKLVGPILPLGSAPFFSAYASCAKDGAPKHPSKKVLNAFTRRGASVHVTAGDSKCRRSQVPQRAGWSNAIPQPFHERVEA